MQHVDSWVGEAQRVTPPHNMLCVGGLFWWRKNSVLFQKTMACRATQAKTPAAFFRRL